MNSSSPPAATDPASPPPIPFLDRHSLGQTSNLLLNHHELCISDAPTALTALAPHSSPFIQNISALEIQHTTDAIILLTPPASTDDCAAFAELNSRLRQLTVVIDHYRHAELLAHAARLSSQKPIAVLLALETGHQLLGVRPGPDCHTLAHAISRLPQLKLHGIYISAETHGTPTLAQALPAPQALSLARQTLHILNSRGIVAHEIFLAVNSPHQPTTQADPPQSQLPQTQTYPHRLILVPTYSCSPTPPTPAPPGQPALARIISRPALDYCILAAGSRSGIITPQTQVIAPVGASLGLWSAHYSQLRLTGPALDSQIGHEAHLVLL